MITMVLSASYAINSSAEILILSEELISSYQLLIFLHLRKGEREFSYRFNRFPALVTKCSIYYNCCRYNCIAGELYPSEL